MTQDDTVKGGELWRRLAPQVLAAVTRRYGDFGVAEDAVQEALLAAAAQWPADGIPADPRAWLITVASRRFIDRLRSDSARRRRELASAATTPDDEWVTAAPDDDETVGTDDTLLVLLLCCHPVLTPASQVALTLRAVGGLTTAQIARAFLVPESTMAQRISRAKDRIREAGARFEPPAHDDLPDRMRTVLQVLYLVFTEGYTASGSTALQDVELAREAIRLTRVARGVLPEDCEVAGLLALMLLTDSRRAARTSTTGDLSRSTSRTAGCGTGPPSRRARSWCRKPCRAARSGPTSCRPPSPPCTPRRRWRTSLTGRRSTSSTACSSRWHPTPSSP